MRCLTIPWTQGAITDILICYDACARVNSIVVRFSVPPLALLIYGESKSTAMSELRLYEERIREICPERTLDGNRKKRCQMVCETHRKRKGCETQSHLKITPRITNQWTRGQNSYFVIYVVFLLLASYVAVSPRII